MEMGTVAQGWLVYEITGSALALGWVSSARNVAIITNQTLIQAACTDEYRGRIMSMYMVTIGLLPLGTIPAGAMADKWGVSSALMVQGALMAAVFGVFWLSRRVRDLR